MRVMRRFAGIREDLASAFQIAPDAIRGQFHRIEHHTAHLASTFFVSPFDRAAVLSADGLGDFASSMSAVGEGPKMRVLGEVAFPHSLGMYYTALTQYVGFWKFGDEYKVMGLAAYGQPEFLEEFRRIVWSDGPLSFRLGLEYFTHQNQGADMTWRDATSTPVLGRLFSNYLEQRLGPARKAGEPLTERHYNLAASMQAALEEVLIAYWNWPREAERTEGAVPRGRRGVQLRGQRANFRDDAFRERVGSAGGGRCGIVRGRGFCGTPSDSRPPARIRDGARLLGTAVFTRRNSRSSSTEWARRTKSKSRNSTKRSSYARLRSISPTGKSSAGSRELPNGGRARSAIGAFWRTRGALK